jgi:2-iminobutanoate/2-iminopropanoate deaminase
MGISCRLLTHSAERHQFAEATPGVELRLRKIPNETLSARFGFVFIAGQGPINPKTQKMELGDIKSETRLELTNISTILTAAGSSMENVVKVSVYLGDLNDFEAMNQVYTEFFKDNYPARTTIQAVLRSGRKIEIDCIARVNQ